jgi:hypothetical protein
MRLLPRCLAGPWRWCVNPIRTTGRYFPLQIAINRRHWCERYSPWPRAAGQPLQVVRQPLQCVVGKSLAEVLPPMPLN